MVIRLTAASRACLLDSTQPGSLTHDVLAGAPVIKRPGDPQAGLYEVDCSEADCNELIVVASKHCPEAVREIEAGMGRHSRS
jgi:hypothetical protein